MDSVFQFKKPILAFRILNEYSLAKKIVYNKKIQINLIAMFKNRNTTEMSVYY